LSKPVERVAPFGGAAPAKGFVCELEGPQLRICNPVIVDEVLLPQAFDVLFQARGLQARKFRNCIHIDVERIEEKTTVRGIGAGVGRPVIEQGVQRVEPDARGAQIGGKLHERGKIGKVAMPPVVPRPHSVKLHGERPYPPWRGFPALIGPLSADHQADVLGQVTPRACDGDTQSEDAVLERAWQRQQWRRPLALGNLVLRKDLPPQR
jgi:hypothetical protein